MASRLPERWLRPLVVAVTLVLLGVATYEFVMLWGIIDDQDGIGVDLVFYRDVAQRWLDTGVYYTERQLSGPYVTTTLVDNLYPPHALYLFLPWVVLPAVLWWAVPAIVIGSTIWWLRPRLWVWPILALIVALPKTPVAILYGNSDLWVATFVALAVRWWWPAVFITFKPSIAFLAALGMTRRSWWVAAVLLGVATLPQLPLWLEWPTAISNSTVTAQYSLAAIPFMILPLVAWLGSSRRAPLRMPTLTRPASPPVT
jgi:hypothetical protein